MNGRAVNFACPHCNAPYYSRVITSHGPIRCGKCGRTFVI